MVKAPRKAAKKPGKQPVDVRVTELPAAFTTLLQSLTDRLSAMEKREESFRQTIADLEDRIDQLEEDASEDMILGSGNPVVNPLSVDPNTKSVDAGEFAQALGEQLLDASDDNSDFTIDNISVEILGGLGQEGDRAQIATNATHQATSQAASKIAFTVKRRRPTKVID